MEIFQNGPGETSPCQACGACCATSRNWPRFTIEDDAALDLIPAKFVNDQLSGMRCEGERCSALSGRIGVETSCAIYAMRPEVCRTCMPGDPECSMARRRHGLPQLVVPAQAKPLPALRGERSDRCGDAEASSCDPGEGRGTILPS